MGDNEAVNFLIAIVFLVGLAGLGAQSVPMFQASSDAGFGTSVDKTAPRTELEIEPEPHVMKIEDISLALLLLDDFHPDPEIIRIKRYDSSGLRNSITYEINNDFLNNRVDRIKSMKSIVGSYLPSTHTVTYELETDNAGRVSWIYSIRE